MPTFRLTKLVTIRKADKPTSDFGYSGQTPEVVTTAWAELTPLSGTERVAAEQVTPGTTHRVVIRWPNVDIEPGMVLRCNGQDYEIQAALDYAGDGQYLDISCTRHRGTIGRETTR
jgi:SPP1 family predicted phage head-tail adaptor